jgi:hypothetical protein
MAQSKTILFLGRTDNDTGYEFCKKLAADQRWRLNVVQNELKIDNYILNSDYVFAGGYLVALEGFANKKIVLASFDNPIKKDYWLMHPMSKYIGFNGNIPKEFSAEAYEWAKNQTWEYLARTYESLWQLK